MPKCEITLWNGCSPVSLLHIFTVFFLFLRKITIETNLTNFAGVIIFWMVDAFTAKYSLLTLLLPGSHCTF